MQPLDQKDVGDTEDFIPPHRLVSQFYEAEPRTRVTAEIAGKTHPGLIRGNNEDQYLAVRRYRGRDLLATSLPEVVFESSEDNAYALAVADGMGGQRFGGIASLLAMRTGWELGGQEIKWPVRMNEHEIEELRRKAEVFTGLIDEALRAEIRDNPKLAGMGTTMTICYSTGPNLFTVHVGDSRAYLLRAGTLFQLTRDHNLGQLLIDAGTAEPGSPEVLRVRHVLTNCFGGPSGEAKADVDHYLLEDGDRVLVCSDGLNDMVDDPEIAATLNKHASPSDACAALIDLALSHGGKDNVTAVVANYRFEDPA